MRILQVIPFFYPAWSFAGTVQCAYHISKELVKRGHDVTVYTTNALDLERDFKVSKSSYLIDGIKVRYFKNILRPDKLYISPDLIGVARKEIPNFDIIHTHVYPSFQNIVIHHFAKKWGKPYVVHAHGTASKRIHKKIFNKLFDITFGLNILEDAAKLIALSNIEHEEYLNMGLNENKIVIIPNGVDADSFTRLPKLGSFKKKWGISENNNIILYVGRIHRVKGIDFLLDAFAKSVRKHVVLVIVGPYDGYLSSVEERVRKLGINDRVIFTGYLSEEDKLATYVDSKMVVYPAAYEPFGLVPLEAALCLRPVIVASGNVMAEIVKQGDFGLTVQYGNIFSLAKVMEILLTNEHLANEMGRKGRDFVMKNFSWDNITEKLEKVYAEVVEGRQ